MALGKRVKGPFVTDETVVAIGIFIGLPLYLSHAGPSVDLHHSEQSYPLRYGLVVKIIYTMLYKCLWRSVRR